MASSPETEFADRLAAVQKAVETVLAGHLSADDRWPPRLVRAMSHAVLGGGKRFRPFLVVETAGLFGAAPSEAHNVAAALECVHCYSLVHDDLPCMDNDEVRRGQPTVWKAFDEWTAVLAGDALLTLAFEILATHLEAPPAVQMQLVRDLALASGGGGMIGGQVLDLEADRFGFPRAPTMAHVRRLQAMKTGALIRFGCTAGARLGGTPDDVETMRRFGDHLGFAFQISDDLLDATGDAAKVGKAVAKDAAAGKATLLSLMGLEGARAKLAEVARDALAELDRYGSRAEGLRGAVHFMTSRES